MNFLITLLLLIVSLAGLTQRRIDRDYFIQLLNNGKYNEAFGRAMEIRKKPFGKNAVIDYFIAKSLCLKGLNEESQVWFKFINQQYPLQPNQRSFIHRETELCRQPVSSSGTHSVRSPQFNFNYINYAPLPEAGVYGKGGFTMDCQAYDKSTNTELIPTEKLETRLFDVGAKTAAYSNIKTIVNADYKVDTSGRFLVVSLKSKSYSTTDIKQVIEKLEQTYLFYLNKYRLQPSDKLFTVYLLPDKRSLQKTAKLVHGIHLPSNSIGYSSLSDLTLLGIANPNSVGTLYHELFHLTIRTEVGDVPPWLDEGIACMFSVYKKANNELVGSKDTWRIMHFKLLSQLSRNKVTFPNLGQLISMNWQEFEGGEERNICVASIHYALSNMFLLYLQDKGLVEKMVFSFKERLQTQRDSFDVGVDNINLVESVFGSTINFIDDEFQAWMQNNYNIEMKKLVSDRPFSENKPWPVRIQTIMDSTTNLLGRVAADTSLVAPDVLINLRNRGYDLKNSYIRTYESMNEFYSQQLRNAKYSPDEESWRMNEIKDLEKKLSEAEEDMNRFNKELTDILGRKK